MIVTAIIIVLGGLVVINIAGSPRQLELILLTGDDGSIDADIKRTTAP